MRLRSLAAIFGLAGALASSACTNLIASVASDTLSASVLNQDDPALVESGLPAYLLLVDGMISQSPDSEGLLAAGAQVFSLYGSRFEPDPARSAELTGKGRRYGRRALCIVHEPACGEWDNLPYDTFVSELSAVSDKNVEYLYVYAISWLSYLDATSEDWSAVAELPWVEAALERALQMDETHADGGLHGYLGILNALRPPALGGRPEVAREHFERAIALSDGRDLSIKVEYARRYARMVFDRALHDELLREVIAAPAEEPGYTLFNVLAQRDAQELLQTSEEYF